MPSVLPPVTDCGCTASAASSSTSSSGCCPIQGVSDPNADGIIPPDTTIWFEYRQLADLVAGPVVQIWYWNPNLAVWQ